MSRNDILCDSPTGKTLQRFADAGVNLGAILYGKMPADLAHSLALTLDPRRERILREYATRCTRGDASLAARWLLENALDDMENLRNPARR